jgi:APA family basic amino acid/polyamine antiporter
MDLFRKKPISAFEQDMKKSELKRVLGKIGLTSLGVGAIIGTGIFVLTGIAAHEHAGPALAISFVIAGMGCTFAALCYAEFASILPVEGSAYAYAYGTVGEFFAWVVGWSLILEYAMGSATVAVGWSGYVVKLLDLFGIHLPIYLAMDYSTAAEKIKYALETNTMPELQKHYTSVPASINELGFAFNLPAFLIIWFITVILVRGIKEAASTNNLMVFIKLSVVIFVIAAGAFYVDTANWTPFIPERIIDEKGNGHFGWQGVMTAASIVFFAYIGFDAVSAQAGEAKNPRTDVPFAIVSSLLICTILYILMSLVLTGMVNYKDIDMSAPVSAAFKDRDFTSAAYIITIAAVAGLTSVLLVMLLSQTRIFLGMAKDGLLPFSIFGILHPVYKTPYRSTILIGSLVSLVSALTPIERISEMTSIGTLLAFAMVCGAVWLLRVREPNQERAFKVPLLPVVAILGIGFNVFLMTQLRYVTWISLVIWTSIGLLVYFLYSYRNSKLNKSQS